MSGLENRDRREVMGVLMLFSNRRVIQIFLAFLFLVLITMTASSLSAQSPPSINSFSVPSSVKEMGKGGAWVGASDPDGDSLIYTWSFESDPTGKAVFYNPLERGFSSVLSGPEWRTVTFGVGDVGEGPPGPTDVQGETIRVRLDISDGTSTATATSFGDVEVIGFNEKPVIILDPIGMGTRDDPVLYPGGISVSATESFDPDGVDGIDFPWVWSIGTISGGTTCPGSSGFTLFLGDSAVPVMSFPRVSNFPSYPMTAELVYELTEGLYVLHGSVAAYIASPNGCSDSGGDDGGDDGGDEENPLPQVSVNASTTQAAAGDVVIMSGVIDDPGDTHTQSWMQLDNTTPIALSSTTELNTGFVAPNVNTLLQFRFSATDSAGQSASAEIAILVSANSDGGGGTGDGGTGDGGTGDGGTGDGGTGDGGTGDGGTGDGGTGDGGTGDGGTGDGGTGDGGTGDGGTGDGGSGDGGSGDEGTGSGASTGTNSDCSGLNLPAVATVPATYTIRESLPGQIHASDASDPDNTPGDPILGQAPPPGVTFSWSITNGQGLMSDQSLQGRTTDTVSFSAPQVEVDTTFGLELHARDARGCGTRYPIELIVQDEVVNNDPTLVLSYQVEGQDISGQVPAGNITVESPATILLDASDSSDPDDDPITFSWEKSAETLTSGSTLLSPQAQSAGLTALTGTKGSVTVTATISDDRGGQQSQSLIFVFVGPQDNPPEAVASAMKDGAPLTQPLGNGEELFLDAGSSTVPEGTQEEVDNLVFEWSQSGGSSVFIKDSGQKVAKIRISDISEEEILVFQLKVRNGSAVDTAEINVPVEPGDGEEDNERNGEIHYPIVGVGPLGDGSELQTSLIIDNLVDEDVEDVQILFYDTQGNPMAVDYIDPLDAENPIQSWDSSQPFLLAARASRVIEFVAPRGVVPQGEADVRSGWAWVKSSGHIQGSIRYQLVNEEDGSLIEDVGIPTERPGRDFQTAFRLKDEFAFAVTNPGDSQVVVELSVYDRLDPTTLVASQEILLEPGEMKAMFLDEILVGLEIEEGHLWIRSGEEGDFVLSGLITQNGFFVSAQSISRID